MKYINKKLFLDLMDYFVATTSSDEQQLLIKLEEFIKSSTSNDSIRVFLQDRMMRDLGIKYKVRLTNGWFPKSQKKIGLLKKELGN